MPWWVFVESASKYTNRTGHGRPRREHETLEAAREEANRLFELCQRKRRVHIFSTHETIEPIKQAKQQQPSGPVIEVKRRRRIVPSQPAVRSD